MKILIAEDERITRRSLERQLEQLGHEITAAEDGLQAWELFQANQFDAVVTDWEMPGLGGCDLITRVRQASSDRYVYAILLTSRSEVEDVITGLDAGADDFLCKPFDKGELRARLNAGERVVRLERELANHNRRMAHDLQAGAKYVESMIPAPLKTAALKIDWRYVPAEDLAGDSLGYHWIDDDRLAFYVLDVTGHGLDAALLSVTVLNVLRTMALPETDFTQPEQVLAMLNDKFPMEEHEDRCFTIWYGVFDQRARSLAWSGGGHPDALLFAPDGQRRGLDSQGPLMGMLPGAEYPVQQISVGEGSRLFAFTDGVFEIDRPDGTQSTFAEFADELSEFHNAADPLDRLWEHARNQGADASLEDDFTAMVIDF